VVKTSKALAFVLSSLGEALVCHAVLTAGMTDGRLTADKWPLSVRASREVCPTLLIQPYMEVADQLKPIPSVSGHPSNAACLQGCSLTSSKAYAQSVHQRPSLIWKWIGLSSLRRQGRHVSTYVCRYGINDSSFVMIPLLSRAIFLEFGPNTSNRHYVSRSTRSARY
jgi:hypothetical protein